MGDAGGFEVGGGFAVEGHAHFVVYGFDNEGVPFAGFEGGVVGDLAAFEEFSDLGFFGGIVAHFADVIAHVAVAFVDEGDAGETDLGAAEVAVVGAGEFAVIEFDIDHCGAVEADFAFDDAVFGGDFEAVHGGVGFGDGFAVSGRFVFVAGLGAFEGFVFDGKSGDDFVPDFGGFAA